MKKHFKILVFAAVLFLGVFMVTGCGKDKNTIVGSWAHDSYVYTFNEDKTGNYDYGNSGKGMEFTYEDNGTELSILYTGNTEPLVLKYRKEGNKLIITDSFGKDVEYVKK